MGLRRRTSKNKFKKKYFDSFPDWEIVFALFSLPVPQAVFELEPLTLD